MSPVSALWPWIEPTRQAQQVKERAVPAGVTLGEVVVDGDQVRAAARQRIQVKRQCCDEGLALTGSHLGDPSLVQHHSADHLHVEVPHAKGSDAGLANDRKRLHKYGVQLLINEAFALEPVKVIRYRNLLKPELELIGLCCELLVA